MRVKKEYNYSQTSSKISNNDDNEYENNININSYNSYKSFVSNNISNKNPTNSDNLEDIIYKKVEENEKSLNNSDYEQNGEINEFSKNSIKSNKNSSYLNYDSQKESKNFSDENSQQSNSKIIDYNEPEKNKIKYINKSPKLNFIDDSDEENEKDSKKENKRIGIQYSSLRSITGFSNNDNNLKKDMLISSLKNENFSPDKKYSIMQNISKLNNMLSDRNTISFNEKPRYLSLAYILSNKSSINSFNQINESYSSSKKMNKNDKNNINEIKQAKIIQKWWRKIKKVLDEKIKKIIKIQSVWRGKYVRKEIYDIMYVCYLCQNFNNYLSKALTHHVRLFIWNILFPKKNKIDDKLLKAKELFCKYSLVKPCFQRWKCINKIFLIRTDFNKKEITRKKKKIIIRKPKDILKKYFREWKKYIIRKKFLDKTKAVILKKHLFNKNSKINSNENIDFFTLKEKKSNLDLKLLYLNSIYIKMRLNRLRSAFDFIYNNKLNYKEILRKSSNYNKNNKNNLFLKRYLYKWRNQIKNIEINEMRKKFLIYIINNISRKDSYNLKHKYFSRWKLLTDDYFNKIKKLKTIEKRKAIRDYYLMQLLFVTEQKKVELKILFLKELIRKWKLISLAEKKRRNMIKLYEIIQKTNFKTSEEIYDFEKEKMEKYNNELNNDKEDERQFIEHINNLYNSKNNQKFKFKYNYNNNNKK